MGQPQPVQIPTFAETGWTREQLLDALRHQRELPVDAVNVALQFPGEIDEAVTAVLRRALTEELDRPSDWLLFRGIHILGGARCSTIYRPLIDFLRGPEDALERLGDAITETVSEILASVFDGDASPLQELIVDREADEYVRNAAFGALAFLTFEGRIARADTADFLRRFEEEDKSPATHMAWDGWMAAVGLLGLDELTPRVLAAFADGRIPSFMSEEKHYRALLEQALKHPTDPQRFRDEHLGYFEDTADELASFFVEPEETSKPAGTKAGRESTREPNGVIEPISRRALVSSYSGVPVHNPYKGVGRNDPCPCGSGKKFKKCCGANT